MTTGTIYLIVGNNRSYCFIRDQAGKIIFAHRSAFRDPEVMVAGANVTFQVEQEKRKGRLRAKDVQAA